jgi:hypothetical protein
MPTGPASHPSRWHIKKSRLIHSWGYLTPALPGVPLPRRITLKTCVEHGFGGTDPARVAHRRGKGEGHAHAGGGHQEPNPRVVARLVAQALVQARM